MSSRSVIVVLVVLLAVINSIHCQAEQEASENARDKRTAPLILGFVAKKFGYHLYNQNDIFGLPNEIVLRRNGYSGKPNRRNRPAQEFPQAQAIPQPFPMAFQMPQVQNLGPAPAPAPVPLPIPAQPQRQPAPIAPQAQPQPLPQQPAPIAPQQLPQYPQYLQSPVQQPQSQFGVPNNSDRTFFPNGGNFFPLPFPFPQQPRPNPAQRPQPQPQPQPQVNPMPVPQAPPAPIAPAPQQPAPLPPKQPQMPVQQPQPMRPQPQAPLPPQAPAPAPLPAPARPQQPIRPQPIQPQFPQQPQFPTAPAPVPQAPQQPPPTGPAFNDIDLTQFQRRAPDSDPNILSNSGEVNFDYSAIDPRAEDFENNQFLNTKQGSSGSTGSGSTNDLAQRYISAPGYDNDQVLRGFSQQFEPSAAPAPTATASDAEEYNNFAAQTPDQQSQFNVPQSQDSSSEFNGQNYQQQFPVQSQQQESGPQYQAQDQPQFQEQSQQSQIQFIAPSVNPSEINQDLYQQSANQEQQQQGGRNTFALYRPQFATRAPSRGKILNIDQLEFEEFGKRPQQSQSQFRSEYPTNRDSFNVQAAGPQNYEINIVKALELPSESYSQGSSFEFGSRSAPLQHSQLYRSPTYLPPLESPPQAIQRRHVRQGKGQSTSQMSFRSNDGQQYEVKTNHQIRSKHE